MVCAHQSEKRTQLFSCLLIGDVDEAARLAPPQCSVMAVEAKQLVMRALFDDAAAVEHDQPVHPSGRLWTDGERWRSPCGPA
jgi:hypothetical protein